MERQLNLPNHVVLSLLSGKVEEIEGKLKTVEEELFLGFLIRKNGGE